MPCGQEVGPSGPTGASEACVLQAVGVLAVNGHRIGFEQAGQSKHLVDLIQVVHPIVITDNHAQMRAAAANQAVIGFVKGQRAGAQHGVTHIQRVGQRAGAAPGVIAHPIDLVRAFAAGAGRNPLRVFRVETGGAFAVE